MRNIHKIHNRMLKETGYEFRKYILKYLNKSFYTGEQPNDWQFDNLTPISKPNKDHNFPENYRSIAVSSCLGRLLPKILAKRIQHYTYIKHIFDHIQSGFQLNRSTTDCILPLYLTILQNHDINSVTQLLQTDFSKSYDTIWHQ